ncbi:hypothetical protein D3C77_673440 [compost metagenome]
MIGVITQGARHHALYLSQPDLSPIPSCELQQAGTVPLELPDIEAGYLGQQQKLIGQTVVPQDILLLSFPPLQVVRSQESFKVLPKTSGNMPSGDLLREFLGRKFLDFWHACLAERGQ